MNAKRISKDKRLLEATYHSIKTCVSLVLLKITETHNREQERSNLPVRRWPSSRFQEHAASKTFYCIRGFSYWYYIKKYYDSNILYCVPTRTYIVNDMTHVAYLLLKIKCRYCFYMNGYIILYFRLKPLRNQYNQNKVGIKNISC